MYENFYKLTTSPFRLSPDPSFFFGSKGHNRALAYLRYGLQQKEGFIVVTGTPGTGKTTISRTLLQEVSREKVIVAELNTTHLDASDVLRMVTASFGLDFESADKATLLKRLETYFISRYRAGYHVLLIVDEAQNLPFDSIEELRMLSNFYQGKNALIQIFLLGQEQFRDRLYSPDLEQLRQRVVASCHLEPLNQVETREYIEHRLTLVGWKHNPQISDRAFVRIFTLTKGIPRRINTFCDRLFLFGALDGLHHLKDEHIKDVAKELMYEVSAKDVALSDIKSSDPNAEISDTNVDSEMSDSLQLDNFSDDTPEVPELKEPVVDLPTLPTSPDAEISVSTGSDQQPLRVVANSNAVAKVLNDPEPMIAAEVADHKDREDWWKLLAIAVNYYQHPNNHSQIDQVKHPLADGITEMLKVATGKKILSAEMRIDELAGVTDDELKLACVHYIENVLLNKKSNYYRRMGVPTDASLELVRTHYRYLFRLLQNEQDAENEEGVFIRRINQAFSTLRSPEKRKEYDGFLTTITQTKQSGDVNVVPNLTLKDGTNKTVTVSRRGIDQVVGSAEENISSVLIDETYAPKTPAQQSDQAKKSSSGFWSVFILVLIVSGGAFYYFQSNIEELKEQFTFGVPESLDANENASSEVELDEFAVEKLFSELKLEGSESVLEPEVMTESVKVPVVEATLPKLVAPKPAIVEKPKPIIKPKEIVVVKTPVPVPEKIKAEPKRVIEPKPIIVATVVKKVVPVVKAAEIIAKPVIPVVKPVIVKPTIVAKPVNVMPSIPLNKETLNTFQISSTDPVSISDQALSSLMLTFASAYEDGEINDFMAVFSKDVLTNNDETYSNILKDYDSLFKGTEMRVFDLKNLKWIKNGQTAKGEADFVVTVLRHNADRVQKFVGKITFDVIRIDDRLKIKGMYHSYGEN